MSSGYNPIEAITSTVISYRVSLKLSPVLHSTEFHISGHLLCAHIKTCVAPQWLGTGPMLY
jgi:hypothetical protein